MSYFPTPFNNKNKMEVEVDCSYYAKQNMTEKKQRALMHHNLLKATIYLT